MMEKDPKGNLVEGAEDTEEEEEAEEEDKVAVLSSQIDYKVSPI